MRDLVLDIDFDFCVRPTLERAWTDRDQAADLRVWLSDAELADWLAARGLLRPETFAGVVERHHEVLPIWAALVASGRIRTPFGVLHVDAHPDLMDLLPDVAARFDEDDTSVDDLFRLAGEGDFLQFPVRLGWVDAIWLLFPDHEAERIAALARASFDEASSVVKKPVSMLAPTAGGGVELSVTIGGRRLPVGLYTRASLPALPAPTATVLTHSPAFVPPSSDRMFSALRGRLVGETC